MTDAFKPFDQMTPEDYAAIGLRCGLEVHQQLLTGRKLFCRCPAGRFGDEYDAEVLRHMRPTLSELGEYDGTALMERKTKKNIHYRIHHATVCTYEIDDTPPFFPDQSAIDIALEISLLLGLNIVGEMHIARKQYLDGSIPAGFQRTAILGVTGSIPYKDRTIGIRQLSLEEDSCREVSDVGHERVLLTDRLGMPLIEVVTEPDMRTPDEMAEVCQIVRMLCRSTGKVRTGYGAARQDVNVSVNGGTRIEIKGVPQIPRIPLLVYNEARRQCALLAIRDELAKRSITADTIRWKSQDVTRIVARTHYQPIREAVDAGHVVKCVVLDGFADLLNETTQEHTAFAKEFSDRVRVIACLTRQPNIIHSDASSETLAVRDWKELHRRTKSGEGDALILVWGSEPDTETACHEIAIRATEATRGVPADTRQALKDGTNGFERVLPGAERMYPDTDLPPMVIEEARLARIRAQLPELVWEREARYRKLSMPEETIAALCARGRADLFDRLTNDLGVDTTFAAVILTQWLKALRRRGLDPSDLRDDDLFAVFEAHARGELGREGVRLVIARALATPTEVDQGVSGVAAELREIAGNAMDDREIENRIDHVISAADGALFPDVVTKHRFLMGRLVRQFAGRVDGARVDTMLAAALDIGKGGARRELRA